MTEATNAAVWSDDRSSPDAGPKLAQPPYGWLLPSAFWIPGWNFSSRIAHLPFYFWLIDATRPRLIVDLAPGRPDDYLAFCQAVEQLNYGAECLGLTDIFDKRDSESDVSSPGAYHDAHFDSISHLQDEPAQIFEALGSRTIDLFHIDGRQTSKRADVEQWLARLSPGGLVIIVHPEHLAPSWRKILKKRPSFILNGKPNVELIAATGTFPRQLNPAFKDDGNPAVATMRSAFEHFGSTLRERASHRDALSFASRIESSLAQQFAATDLLRAEKTELEEKVQRQAPDQIRSEARIATLEQYVEQFRAEVLRLQEYAIKTQTEIERVQRIAGDLNLESERLQRVIADRDTEIRRLGNYSQKLRLENNRRINALDDKIQEGEDEILRLSTLLSQHEGEIARLSQLRDDEVLRHSTLASQSESEIARLNQLIVDGEREIVRLNKVVIDNQNESARAVNQLVTEVDSKVAQLNEIIADRDEVVRLANERAILQREQAASHAAELTTAIFQSESRVYGLQRRVLDLENILNDITQSTAWRITSPVRRFFTRFPGSARFLRRALKLLWWTLSFQLVSRLKQTRHPPQRLPQPAVLAADPVPDTPSPPSPFNATSSARSEDTGLKSNPTVIESEATPNRNPADVACEPEAIPPVLDDLPKVFMPHGNSLLQSAHTAPRQLSSPASKGGQIRQETLNQNREDTASGPAAVTSVLDRLPFASTTDAVLQSASETLGPPSSSISIDAVFARINDFEDRVNGLASSVSLLDAPAPAPHIVDRAPEVHRLGMDLERESVRIQLVENRVLQLTSIVELERHRTDYALLGVDGMLKEIELYHSARAKTDYNRAFQQQMPLVSICVSTMNRADILVERCLNSLVNQSYRNIQVIVVGDHCTDDTGSRVARLRDDRISFHNLPSRGPYPPPGTDRWMVAGTNAINAAMTMCEGQFVTHLDDDDVATFDRIETLVNAAQQHKADFCWHPFWCENKDGSWYRLGDGRFELAQITTGSTNWSSSAGLVGPAVRGVKAAATQPSR